MMFDVRCLMLKTEFGHEHEHEHEHEQKRTTSELGVGRSALSVGRLLL
jgi:hypothetical protein